MLVDSHAHLDAPEFDDDRDAVLARARAAGVTRQIVPAVNATGWPKLRDLCARESGLLPAYGLHPMYLDDHREADLESLRTWIEREQPVAVGECGLDYFYEHSPRDAQREVFAAQIALAHAHDLALVIHTREAWDDTFDVLAAEGVPERTVFHCFTGGPDEARRCLDAGGLLSISGIVTFKTAEDVRAAVAICPPDRLLVETDSPFLAPVPHRGRKNQPAFVPLVGAAVAEVQGRDVAEVARTTTAAAAQLYRLPA